MQLNEIRKCASATLTVNLMPALVQKQNDEKLSETTKYRIEKENTFLEHDPNPQCSLRTDKLWYLRAIAHCVHYFFRLALTKSVSLSLSLTIFHLAIGTAMPMFALSAVSVVCIWAF